MRIVDGSLVCMESPYEELISMSRGCRSVRLSGRVVVDGCFRTVWMGVWSDACDVDM